MPRTETRLRLADLVTDPATGRFSHTRLWSNIGCAAATVLFVKMGWSGQLTADIWLIYLGSVGGFAAVSKALSLRYKNPPGQAADAYGYTPPPQQGGPL